MAPALRDSLPYSEFAPRRTWPHDRNERGQLSFSPPSRRRSYFSTARVGWNGVKTAVLLAALGGLLVGLGSLFGNVGTTIGLVAGLAAVGGSYWFSDRLALLAARAVPVSDRELPAYHRIVQELAVEAGLPMPKLYVTPDRQPNAFATGRNPRHAAVAVTQGLLDLLTPRELKAVLAHELAHVGNRDILLTSVAAALATGISFLANVIGWLPFFGSSDDEEDPGPLAMLVTALVAPIAAALLQLALSRSREYEADRTGAALLGDGQALASALAKIDHAARYVPMSVEPSQSSKYLVNPLRGSRRSLSVLFMTHPPVADRIARLVDHRVA
ncbi:M48 family metalloprotease [Blastococcus sp. KM273129]|uniref:M48 family metalloprotease n=1 Tax=Blastococcus sp. KM273129 TaxID=2570315 RepID=UPI001F008ECD|nr:M48 family metalloprotease [Blastococcus sp. KM273129]MCF6733667.1 protease HtpX [Blastococcus sp. KM273129]